MNVCKMDGNVLHIKFSTLTCIVVSATLLGAYLISCSERTTTQATSQGNNSSYIVVNQEVSGEDQFLFLGFLLTETASGDSVSLQMKTMNEGKIVEVSPVSEMDEGDIRLTFLDSQGMELKSLLIENPSVLKVESFAQSGELEGHTLETRRVEFFVRVNYLPEMTFLRILRKQASGEERIIGLLNVNEL